MANALMIDLTYYAAQGGDPERLITLALRGGPDRFYFAVDQQDLLPNLPPGEDVYNLDEFSDYIREEDDTATKPLSHNWGRFVHNYRWAHKKNAGHLTGRCIPPHGKVSPSKLEQMNFVFVGVAISPTEGGVQVLQGPKGRCLRAVMPKRAGDVVVVKRRSWGS